MSMRVQGTFKPPFAGTHVEPYPLSGPGAIELELDRLRVEGSRGLPWEVQLLGAIGLVIGCVAFYLVAGIEGSQRSSFAGFGALLACVAAGSALGYAASARRARPVRVVEFPLAAIAGADRDGDRVTITVTFVKRWQTRRQMIHFTPASAVDGAALVDALSDRLA